MVPATLWLSRQNVAEFTTPVKIVTKPLRGIRSKSGPKGNGARKQYYAVPARRRGPSANMWKANRDATFVASNSIPGAETTSISTFRFLTADSRRNGVFRGAGN